MTKSPRLRDVAEHASVSIALVSSYLNTPDLVGKISAQRIEHAIRELRFVPNDAARQLRRGTSRMIAFVAFDVGDPFFASVARGAQARASAAGLSLVLADTSGRADTEQEYLTLFEEQRVRGILLAPAGEPKSYLDGLELRRIPAVLIDQPAPSERWSSVSINDVLGGELATRHLLELGRRRIAVVGGDPAIRQVSDRRQGALNASAAYVGSSVSVWNTDERNVGAGRRAALAIIDSTPRPDAVFCINDSIAGGVLQVFAQAGIKVPADIAVIGYNDVAADASAIFSLSSIRQPHEAFGAAAIDLLMDEIAGGPRRQLLFDPELVVRQSTAGP